jgi:hypothetical protein
MRHVLRWVAALVVPAMLLAGGPADAQKMDKDKDKDKDVTTEKMIKAGVLVGKVTAVYEDKRTIRLQVAVSLTKLNPSGLQQLQQAQLDLVNARARGDRNAMMSAQRSIVQAQGNLYSVEKRYQDVELQALDDAVVRTARPRGEFDEKGKLKKLTAKQLKELKGPDPKLPGYKAEFGDVATEQILQVTLVKKKQTGAAAKPKPSLKKPKGKKKDKDDEEEAAVDVLADNLPQVSQIVILIDPPPTAGG